MPQKLRFDDDRTDLAALLDRLVRGGNVRIQ
jgi:hypothetical protein